MNTKLNADESASFLAGKLRRQEPFSYWRFGDGFLELVLGKPGQTCDGERYDANLGDDLGLAVTSLLHRQEGVHFGDWQSASFSGPNDPARYRAAHRTLFGGVHNWLHFEALLFMRQSAPLVDFYRAVAEDPRRKLFMGPVENHAMARALGCETLATPMSGMHNSVATLTRNLLCGDFDVLLFGAGMAGNIPVVNCWQDHPERTYINLGSSLDILGRGRSRKQQISAERARAMFDEALTDHTAASLLS